MNTLVINSRENLSSAADLLRNGGLVAVPTETVYGLAGNGLDSAAVEKIYEVKGRPAVKPLSLMVSGKECIDRYCTDVPSQAYCLADAFWPGPVTIVLRSRDIVPDIVRAGGSTVGLRCPDSPLTLSLLKLSDIPFAAPSANPSGADSPKSAEAVLSYFDGAIDAVVDGGVCRLGLESTIIDMSAKPFRILRQGSLERERIVAELTDNLTLIGITGCTGSGKTTALNVLKEFGAEIIDCDAVYHEMLVSDYELKSAILTAFPEAESCGEIDRKLLGKAVFNDSARLEELNRVTHVHVLRKVRSYLEECAMNGAEFVAVDAIELFSSGLGDICDFTLAVTADENTRAERIVRRDGISMEYALQRIRAQKDPAYFAGKADAVIDNSGSEGDFINKCKSLFERIFINE